MNIYNLSLLIFCTANSTKKTLIPYQIYQNYTLKEKALRSRFTALNEKLVGMEAVAIVNSFVLIESRLPLLN